MDRKVYSLLGFAAKSKSLVYGKERIRGYIKSPLAVKVVVVATDASPRLKRDLKVRCENSSAMFVEMFTKRQLGKLVGKREVAAFGVESEGIARGILKVLEGR